MILSQPFLHPSICVVLLFSTQPEVVGPDANAFIAAMANAEPLRNGAIDKLPSHTVGTEWSLSTSRVAIIELAIAVAVKRGRPNPTGTLDNQGAIGIDLGPEASGTVLSLVSTNTLNRAEPIAPCPLVGVEENSAMLAGFKPAVLPMPQSRTRMRAELTLPSAQHVWVYTNRSSALIAGPEHGLMAPRTTRPQFLRPRSTSLGAMTFTTCTSALTPHISHVVCKGSYKQMLRVHAWWIVAAMENAGLILRRVAVYQQPGETVSQIVSFLAGSEHTVAAPYSATGPEPTGTTEDRMDWTSLIDLRPKANGHGFAKLRWGDLLHRFASRSEE